MINLHTKFELSSFIHSKDRTGTPGLKMTVITPLLGVICHAWTGTLDKSVFQIWKCVTSPIQKIGQGPKIEERSRDANYAHFGGWLVILKLGLDMVDLYTRFEFSASTNYGDRKAIQSVENGL